jgi:hypothetical protein
LVDEEWVDHFEVFEFGRLVGGWRVLVARRVAWLVGWLVVGGYFGCLVARLIGW